MRLTISYRRPEEKNKLSMMSDNNDLLSSYLKGNMKKCHNFPARTRKNNGNIKSFERKLNEECWGLTSAINVD